MRRWSGGLQTPKFWIDPYGDLSMDTHVLSRIPGRDTARWKNDGGGRYTSVERLFFGLNKWALRGAAPRLVRAGPAVRRYATCQVRLRRRGWSGSWCGFGITRGGSSAVWRSTGGRDRPSTLRRATWGFPFKAARCAFWWSTEAPERHEGFAVPTILRRAWVCGAILTSS